MQDVGELFRAALTAHRSGDARLAHSLYEQIIALDPDHADALNLLGVLTSEDGGHQLALAYIDRAIRNNDSPIYTNNRGIVLKRQGRIEEARACFEAALTGNENYLDAAVNLATLLHDVGEHDSALSTFQRFEPIAADRADFLFNYSRLRIDRGELQQARELLEKLLAASPDDTDAAFEYGMVLKSQGNIEAAIEVFDKITGDQRLREKARWYLAQCYLLLERFDEGWPLIDARVSLMPSQQRRFSIPKWDGSASTSRDQGIVVWAEQGLGDELMYSALIPSLIQKFNDIHYECDARLLRLFERTHPDIHFFARDHSRDVDATAMQAAVHCPIGDLPKYLNPALQFEPADYRFLDVSKSVMEPIERLVRTRSDGRPLVGLSAITTGISAELRMPESAYWEALIPFADRLQFVDLQGPVEGQPDPLRALRSANGVMTLYDIDLHADIESLAAVIVSMDQIITIDNTIAHLAGRLGQRTAVLLSSVHDWRWFISRSDTPWYPNTRLVRQQTTGDWKSTSGEIEGRLVTLGKGPN